MQTDWKWKWWTFSHKIARVVQLLNIYECFFFRLTMDGWMSNREFKWWTHNRSSFLYLASLSAYLANGFRLMTSFHMKWNINWWILMMPTIQSVQSISNANCTYSFYSKYRTRILHTHCIWIWTLDIDEIKPNVCYAQNNFQQLNIKNISIIQREKYALHAMHACVQNDRAVKGEREGEKQIFWT